MPDETLSSSSEEKTSLHPREIKWHTALGEGAFGLVRRVEFNQSKRAVKLLKGSDGPRCNATMAIKAGIETQLKVLKELRHDRIVVPEALGYSSAGDPMFVTEYAEHGDLESVLSTWPMSKLTLNVRLLIASQVATGMVYLHKKKPVILHLDLKPGNILIFPGEIPSARIADFGISAVLQQNNASIYTQFMTGTVPYAAPEALNPDMKFLDGKDCGEKCGLNRPSDVFSFGMVLFRLFTDSHPFSRELAEGGVGSGGEQANEEGKDELVTFPLHRLGHLGLINLRHAIPTLLPSLDHPPPWMLDDIWVDLKALMEDCWRFDPRQRPTFIQVANRLQAICAKCDPAAVEKQLEKVQQQMKEAQLSAPQILLFQNPALPALDVQPVGSGAGTLDSMLPSPWAVPQPAAAAAAAATSPGAGTLDSMLPSPWGVPQPQAPTVAAATPGAAADAGLVAGSLRTAGPTPFLDGPGMSYPASGSRLSGEALQALAEEGVWLDSLFQPAEEGGAAKLSANAVVQWLQGIGSKSGVKSHELPKLARRLIHALRWLSHKEVDASYSLKDVADVADCINSSWKGWDPLDFDVLPLTFTALDWLLGVWGAMEWYSSPEGFKLDKEQLLEALKLAGQGVIANKDTFDEEGEDVNDIQAAAEEASKSDGGFGLCSMLQNLKKSAAYVPPEVESLEQRTRDRLDAERKQQETAAALAESEVRKTQQENARALEEKWNALYDVEFKFVKDKKELMGDRYPEAMYLEPVLVNEADRKKMLQILKDYWAFWRDLDAKAVQDLPENFWDKRWVGRGREFRELFEPLDIVNWYLDKNKQWEYKDTCNCVADGLPDCKCKEEGYHYAKLLETPEDEISKKNGRRPGRFLRLQKREKDAYGHTPRSSVELARRFQKMFGPKKWQDVIKQQNQQQQQG